MPKNKKKQNVPDRPLPPLYSVEDIPSQDCKNFLIELIVRCYEEINLHSLESTYVRYREEGPKMFKHDMHVRMTEHLMAPQWNDDYQKRGRSKFVDARVHDSLWNAPNILAKYGREHRAGDDAFNDVLLKADLFVAQMRPFAKSRNRRGSIGWWNSDQGREEDHARMAHLIVIPPTARVFQCDDVVKRGGYATIRKVRIEGAIKIERHWKLAAKPSNN